jgi:hypothetical protein
MPSLFTVHCLVGGWVTSGGHDLAQNPIGIPTLEHWQMADDGQEQDPSLDVAVRGRFSNLKGSPQSIAPAFIPFRR